MVLNSEKSIGCKLKRILILKKKLLLKINMIINTQWSKMNINTQQKMTYSLVLNINVLEFWHWKIYIQTWKKNKRKKTIFQEFWKQTFIKWNGKRWGNILSFWISVSNLCFQTWTCGLVKARFSQSEQSAVLFRIISQVWCDCW